MLAVSLFSSESHRPAFSIYAYVAPRSRLQHSLFQRPPTAVCLVSGDRSVSRGLNRESEAYSTDAMRSIMVASWRAAGGDEN